MAMLLRVFGLFIFLFLTAPAFAQKTDTTRTQRILQQLKKNRLSQRIVGSVMRSPSEIGGNMISSEEVFMNFEGKIIRQILINPYDIGRRPGVRSTKLGNVLTQLGEKLHTTSDEWMIREHLFFQEKKPLNPYRLADNERYLRDRDFIVDARIYVLPLSSTRDSVDVLVVTRDGFSMGGNVEPSSTTRSLVSIYNVNIFGWGQRHQINAIYDNDRDPKMGFETLYTKSSIGGSLINGTVGYSQLDNGPNIDNETEKSYYLRLSRQLVSPYSRFAGALELSRNWSANVYNTPECEFKNYRYTLTDVWVGYNIGSQRNHGNRSRHFAAIRTSRQRFSIKPTQPETQGLTTYNNNTFVLGEVAFYKQDFFKTNYVFGFGRTEDIPYGRTMTLLAGWSNQLGRTRKYIGYDFEKSFVNKSGNFYTLSTRAGTFLDGDEPQDATVLLTGSFYSQLIPFRQFRIRQSLNTSLAFLFNRAIGVPFDINGEFGLRGFSADSLLGTKRWIVNTETVVFTPWQVLGFKFAPIAFADLAFLASRKQHIFYNKPYLGLGAGIRTRNENLVFGTIEARFLYYPRVPAGVDKYRLNFSFNLRVKYTGGFVKAPQFITYN